MIDSVKRITIVTGHYGSGKTNFAVNLAVDLSREGKQVVLVDLDIVNPYFRSADFKERLTAMGIEMICPIYANTNLDIPALGADIYSVFYQNDSRYVIFDVGGDDAGAAALGRYSHLIQQENYDMLLREIETTARVPVTGIINNSNLGDQTTEQDITNAITYGADVAALAGVPLVATTVRRDLAGSLIEKSVYPVDIYVLPPWEK